MNISKRLKKLFSSRSNTVTSNDDPSKNASDKLAELLLRMTDRKICSSAESVSWQAYRDADAIEDTEILEIAKNRLENETDTKIRDALYYLIAQVALNTNSEVADFILEESKKEKDKYVIMSLLDRLEELPKINLKNVDQIIEFSKDKRWQIRLSAIRALNVSSCEAAEQRLIEILGTSCDPDDIAYANSSLRQIGTSRAIPSIKIHLKSRKPDVRLSARYAIYEIMKRELNQERAEQDLMDILKTNNDPFDVICANMLLRTKGTLKAIPAIEVHLKSRNPDVKFTAHYAIHEIKRKHTQNS